MKADAIPSKQLSRIVSHLQPKRGVRPTGMPTLTGLIMRAGKLEVPEWDKDVSLSGPLGQSGGTDPQPRAVGTGFRRGGIDPGDEIFVLLTGSQVGRRVIAHGNVVGSVYRAPRAEDPTRTTNWVDVDWNVWLSPGFGMSLEQAAGAAPSFYWDIWHGGSRIEEGDSLRAAWEKHLDSLPETAFSGEPASRHPEPITQKPAPSLWPELCGLTSTTSPRPGPNEQRRIQSRSPLSRSLVSPSRRT